jgi:GntR family carbon starvation induced transcriptional regulator
MQRNRSTGSRDYYAADTPKARAHMDPRMTGTAESPLSDSASRSLTSIAAEKIRTDIVRCVLRPREKLRIQALCERYAINASAIREALCRLVTDELVEAIDQRGFRVARVSREDLLDLTQTRIAIESQALAKAIEIGDDEWESQVLAAYHRLSKCKPPPIDKTPGGSPGDWETLHRHFHEVLIAGCRSRWLLSICRALYEKSERYRCLAEDYTKPAQRDALGEHRELMDAALNRDAAAACARLAQHFTLTTQIILDGIDSAGSLLELNRRREPASTD